ALASSAGGEKANCYVVAFCHIVFLPSSAPHRAWPVFWLPASAPIETPLGSPSSSPGCQSTGAADGAGVSGLTAFAAVACVGDGRLAPSVTTAFGALAVIGGGAV